jgi:hypothetical protein
MDGDVRPGRSDDDVAMMATARTDSGRSSGGTSGVPPASRHTRTVSAPLDDDRGAVRQHPGRHRRDQDLHTVSIPSASLLHIREC